MPPNFFHHLHPPSIPARQSRWRYTLGAGGSAVFLVLILVVTGALEMFYYIPTPGEAAISVQTITYLVPFGGLIRNLHFWSAQFLLIISAVHLLRIIFTGAYAPPRRFNYLLGLALFALSILLDFSGYILRWDQGIQSALLVGTNLVKAIPAIGDPLYSALTGGTQIGDATLLRFFAWHIFGLTMVMLILVGWHAFRVRRDGGIAVPPAALRSDNARITRAELVQREILAMLLTASTLILFSTFFPAPIASPINLSETGLIPGNPSRAPWFLLWIQSMLKWGNPIFWGLGVPLILLAILALIPFIFPKPAASEQGSWFPRSNRLAQVVLLMMTLFVIVLSLLALFPGA